MTTEGGPPTMQSSVPKENLPVSREEEAIKGKEALQYADMEREFLARRGIDPGEVWIVLSNELLAPSERANLPVSPYESGPLLKECLRRAGASNVVLSLQERATELDGKIHVLRDEGDAQETITDEGKEKKAEIERQIAVMARRLHGRFVQVESNGEVKTTKVEFGLSDRLNKRIEEGGFPEDRREWAELYWKLRGSLTLLDVHNQRERYLSSYETYCEQLFLSGSYKIEIQLSEMLGILKDPVYGLGIEAAMRAYVDVHMGEPVKVWPDGRYVKVREGGKEEGHLGAEFVEALQKYIDTDRPERNDDNSYDLPKPLQVPNEGIISQREIVAAYVKAKAAQPGGYGEGGAERAELLAKRVLEFTLLNVWMSVPRDREGNVIFTDKDGRDTTDINKADVNEFDLGVAKLEGSGSSDMNKIVLAKLKWWKDKKAEKPAGPPSWDWTKLPFEAAAPDFFHSWIGTIKYTDSEGREIFPKGTVTTQEPTIFDLWYRGVGQDKKIFRLSKILEGVKSQDQCALDTNMGIVNNVTRKFDISARPENAFDSWHFGMYKQSRTLGYILNNSRGGKDDCIEELIVPEKFRTFNKDIHTAALGLDLPTRDEKKMVENWIKINIVLARATAWVGTLAVKGEEVSVSKLEVEKMVAINRPRATMDVPNGEIQKVTKSAGLANYLPPKIQEWLEKNTYSGFIDFGEFKKTFYR